MTTRQTVTPAATIGIMTRNYGRYIREAIESVLTQSRADWELVISDDASTDDTPEVVAPYLSDPRICYVRHPKNLGQAGNWGFLLDQGTAPIVTTLHADDYWLPDALETALSASAADPELDLLYGNWLRLIAGQLKPQPAKREPPHRWTGQEEFRYQVTRHTWLPSATFLRRRAAQAAGKPNPALRMLVDTEYFLRVALHARRTAALAQPLMVYRVHPANATAEGKASGQLVGEKEQLTTMFAATFADCPALHKSLRALRRHMAWLIFSEGVSQAAQGHLEAGRGLMRRAVLLDAGILLRPKIAADYALAALGKPSRRLLRRLHHARLRPIEALDR